MTPQEVAQVVARIQAGDNRAVDEVTMAHWAETIGHLNFRDALEAVVMHFRESSEYLVAAHVLRNAARIRQARFTDNDTTPEKWKEIAATGKSAPKPDNFEALTAAWNDPAAWAREIAVYDGQLRAAGFAPVGVRTHSTWREAA